MRGAVEALAGAKASSASRAYTIIKVSKCQFDMEHCVYLGYIVGNGVVKPC